MIHSWIDFYFLVAVHYLPEDIMTYSTLNVTVTVNPKSSIMTNNYSFDAYGSYLAHTEAEFILTLNVTPIIGIEYGVTGLVIITRLHVAFSGWAMLHSQAEARQKD